MLKRASLLCFAAISVYADSDTISESMLYQANLLSKKYTLDLSILPPPPASPQPQECLPFASCWMTIDLASVAVPAGKTALQVVGDEAYLGALKALGIQAIRLVGLKEGGAHRIGLQIDPRFGTSADWEALVQTAERQSISLIGDILGNSTGLGVDFNLALQNVADYPGLYHLVEIDSSDWNLLPILPQGNLVTNIPWLSLQDLYKKGYVPEQFTSYVKESHWNATSKVAGQDGKMRRWIYLKEEKASPVVGWLGSSFAAMRLAAADVLHSTYELGQRIVTLDVDTPLNAQSTLSLWTRKLGAFSMQETEGSFEALENTSSDFLADTVTRPALLHALIAEDAEVLRFTYRLLLERGVDTRRLVHMLQPFDRFTCDWSLWLNTPNKKYLYYDEQLTGDALKRLLLKEDLVRLKQPTGENLPLSTWAGYCIGALQIDDFTTQQEKISGAHQLLAFFYAMQPGAFSVSLSDILGALPSSQDPLDLLGPNESTLYPCLPLQLKTPRSFGAGLQRMLSVRRDRAIESAELIGVPNTPHRNVLILLYRQKGTQYLQLLAINFGRKRAQEVIEMSTLRQTTAIDLMSGLAEPKPLDSASYLLDLPPLSGKIVLFQPKYYN